MQTLAIYNFKGGVGKTATAVNFGYLSAREGARTLVWDLDPQGAATFTFRIRPKLEGGARAILGGTGAEGERAGGAAAAHRGLLPSIRATDFAGLDLLPADFSCRHLDAELESTDRPEERFKELIEPLSAYYDRVVLDCAPSISLVSENVFTSSDALLAPTLPTPLSLRTLAKLVKHLKQRKQGAPPVLPFLCMVDRRKALHRDISAYVVEQRLGFLAATIPYSSTVEKMATLRAPVCSFAPRDRASRAYEALWAEVLHRLASSPGADAPATPRSGSLKALVREVTRSSPDPSS